MPLMQLNIDVFPAPFGPMIAYSSPGSMLKLTEFNAVMPPNFKVTFLKLSTLLKKATFSFFCNVLHL